MEIPNVRCKAVHVSPKILFFVLHVLLLSGYCYPKIKNNTRRTNSLNIDCTVLIMVKAVMYRKYNPFSNAIQKAVLIR